MSDYSGYRSKKARAVKSETEDGGAGEKWYLPLLGSPLLEYLSWDSPAKKDLTLEEFLARLEALGAASLKLRELKLEHSALTARVSASEYDIRKESAELRSALYRLDCTDGRRSVFKTRIATYEERALESYSEDISFDEKNPHRPLVIITRPEDEYEYVIDVIDSLKRAPGAYSDSRVRAAIMRYAKAAAGVNPEAKALDSKDAEQCLKEVNKALIAGVKAESVIDDAYAFIYPNQGIAEDWYLSVVLDVLKRGDVKKARRKEKRLEIVRQRLLEQVPGEDPSFILRFLCDFSSYSRGLAGRGFTDLAELRNAVTAYAKRWAVQYARGVRSKNMKLIERDAQEGQKLLNDSKEDAAIALGILSLSWKKRRKATKRRI
jgi:hypothetical protein